MTLRVYRLVKNSRRNEAFSGAGGVHAHSRWTSRGRPVVYVAESLSLALLEFTVHHRRRNWIPASVMISAAIPENLAIETIEIETLPKDWRVENAPVELRKLGDAWLARNESALLCVPSAIVPEECNYLINPSHPDFHRIEISKPVEYIIDGRLVRTG
ncbi:MAG: RES family NAD+ phosphorylase [Proteobacteria bacterium]|nr:RES family NAD+ phosphorylase [Pseudomonadota bacterium]